MASAGVLASPLAYHATPLAYHAAPLAYHPAPLLRAAPLAYSPAVLRSSTAWGNAAWAPGVTYHNAALPALHLI